MNPEKEPLLPGPKRFEINAVGGCFVVVSAIAFDALGLLPAESTQDVPASFRCSALVLIALLGGPIVGAHRSEPKKGDRISIGDLAPELEQRLVAVGLLVLVAIFGERHGEPGVRAADSIFVLAAGWGAVVLFAMRSSRTAPGSALFAAALLYVGVRLVTQGVGHSAEVMDFKVTREDVSVRGYALSDCVASTALSFGGACCACCGLSILVNDRFVEKRGSQVMAAATSQISCMAFAAALIAQLSLYSSIDALPAIFSASSCAGNHCDAARRARRFFIANSHAGSLWAAVVGMSVFSMPNEKRGDPYFGGTQGRFQDAAHSLASRYFTTNRIPSTGALVAAVVTASVVVSVLYFAERGGSFATAEVTILFLSIPTVWFVSTLAGCALFVVGNGAYIDSRLGGPLSFELTYFTHWSLAASTLIATFLLATTATSWVAYSFACSFKPGRMRLSFVEMATAALTIMLVSVQLALTLMTLSLFAAFDGTLVPSEKTFQEVGFEFTLQHSISFFFSAALYASRFEVAYQDGGDGDRERLSRTVRRVCYYAPPPVLGLCWLATLLILGDNSPYEGGTSFLQFVIGLIAAGVPWLVCGAGV